MLPITSNPNAPAWNATDPKKDTRRGSRSSRISTRGVMLAPPSGLVLRLRNHVDREFGLAQGCHYLSDGVPRCSTVGADVHRRRILESLTDFISHQVDVHRLVVQK